MTFRGVREELLMLTSVDLVVPEANLLQLNLLYEKKPGKIRNKCVR